MAKTMGVSDPSGPETRDQIPRGHGTLGGFGGRRGVRGDPSEPPWPPGTFVSFV